ncbi:leucine efflux protein LeuE [Rugosimonospora africana]|uniref:Putative membrane protein n=1 Tax=Rugosimonospora africana TaxID=556532 RepID=A0A8J3QRA8_9ACTN|nr:leucine efflux protein LeuE [Rugosimonospora africana]GIH13731.1 putative membrane protein [Rugosimonospora africana]
MFGITNIWAYLLGTAAIVLLPGPNSMYVLSTAARLGIRSGYAGAFGVFIGDAVLMTLSAAGVASLLRAQPALFLIVKYAGAGYLCWIGIGMLRRAWRSRRSGSSGAAGAAEGAPANAGLATATASATAAPAVPARSPFRKSLVVSLLNPKAILFFISFFIQFVQPEYPRPWLSFLILGAIVELISAAYLTTLIFTGSYLAAWFRSRRGLSRALATGIGAVFVGFAIKLATTSLS